jgi:hypothetical protein
LPGIERGGGKMQEIITEIREIETDDVSGYEVKTTKQIIKLYISNQQDCCENWGFLWCNDDPQEFIGASILNVSLTDKELNTENLKEVIHDENFEDFMVMFVNIETDRGTLQFIAYNEHNGFYGHEATVECKQLKHKEKL